MISIHPKDCRCTACLGWHEQLMPQQAALNIPGFAPRAGDPSPTVLATVDVRDRKSVPVGSGCYDYFPDALWEVAYLSWAGNEKHNPGEELHDARSKSSDDYDCLLRHLKDRGKWDEIVTKDGRVLHVRHSAAVAWRALRILQKECEAEGAPMAPGARP